MVTENIGTEGAPLPADSPIDMGPEPVADIPDAPVDDFVPAEFEAAAAPAQDAAPPQDIGPVDGVPTAAPVPPAQPQYSPDQINKMRQAAAQYEQVQQRAALQNQVQQYRKQLEDQGYEPEHAEQAANQYMQGQQAQMQLMQRAEAYGQHIQGKQQAAEQFAAKYKLNMNDLAALRVHEDPQSMENAAKKMAGDRARDAELAQLRQARVPAQSLDNSQGNPQVAADEGGWLDRYNSGDRSPSAQAAARKAAGLG